MKKGQVLFRLDPKPFRIALANAQAQLAQAALNVKSMQEDYRRMLSDVNATAGQVDLAQRNYARYAGLLKANAIAAATYDQARLSLATAQQQLWRCNKPRKRNLPNWAAIPTCRWSRIRNISKLRRRS